MTALLQQAFDRVLQLPPELQDQVARQLLEETEWDRRWDASLAASADVLDKLGRKALEQYEAGETRLRPPHCPRTNRSFSTTRPDLAYTDRREG